jgi:transcriptional regulator GlxA family with amidase domain
MLMRVEILMFEGVADMDALLPYDVFARARLLGADVEPVLVTADGATEVSGCYGTRYAGLVPWTPEEADVLVVAGGWIDEEIERGVIPKQLAEAKARGGDRLLLAGVCSGSLLLGAAGLIDGRPATTHRPGMAQLARWAEPVDARIVDDGDLVTAGSGWLSGIDLALYLIDRELGRPQLAAQIEQWIGHDRRGTPWRPPHR